MLSQGTVVRVIDEQQVRAKLIAAAPRILEQNRVMVQTILESVREEILPGTPIGPGHFGVHLRDSYRVEVESHGPQTRGKLSAAVQGYWREFGTRGRYRGRGDLRRAFLRAAGDSLGSGGEKAGLYATRAVNRLRSIERFFYGKAQWWRA